MKKDKRNEYGLLSRSGRFVNRPYEAENRVSPVVWDHRRSEGSKRQRRFAA